MIELGTYDAEVEESTLQAYLNLAKQLTGAGDSPLSNFKTQLRGEGEWESLKALSGDEMKVADVQRFLKESGFFPFGKIDGICGYRTTSAIRLFQEYVRTVEGQSDFTPDGKWGAGSTARARRWQAGGAKADWTQFSAGSPSAECARWLDLLRRVKENYRSNPKKMLTLAGRFTDASDSVKLNDWDFDPKKIHFIGIRRNEATPKPAQKFDDLFVLLINGLAFKFFGSTDPGHTGNPKGYPFLVMGQHRYRFGWHLLSKEAKIFQALKPAKYGVLVVRSKDLALTEADLAAGVENNGTINVHWGGEGGNVVDTWSEGCQVMVGRGYVNHHDQLINCAHFAAPNYATLGTKRNGIYQTKGAYTMLGDLVAALSGANPDDNIVHYMLIYEQDLALSPEIGVVKPAELLSKFQTLA
jgi:peptidoglycan hydrolase-like protein with peptidoglycan-binding domain